MTVNGARSTWNGPARTSSRVAWAAWPSATRRRSGCARSAAVTWRRRSTTWSAPGTQGRPRGWATPTSSRSPVTSPRRSRGPAPRSGPGRSWPGSRSGPTRPAWSTRGRRPRGRAGSSPSDPAEAEAWFARARSAHQEQPMPFEQARTLLCEGEALRRARHPAAARLPLRHALTIFNGLGARPWAARAMIELDATGARAGARNEHERLRPGLPQPARTPSRPRRRARTQQRRGRGGPVRLPQDRGSPPHPRLPQTRRPVPHGTGPPADHPRSSRLDPRAGCDYVTQQAAGNG